MKNIHILPTDKPSRLHLAYDKDFYLSVEPFIQLDTKNYKSFNIYITSDEDIKEGVDQWYLDKVLNEPYNSGGAQYSSKQDIIILTTDQDLIADGVQAIDDEFLEWFVKNPSCKEVGIVDDKKLSSKSIYDAVEGDLVYSHHGYGGIINSLSKDVRVGIDNYIETAITSETGWETLDINNYKIYDKCYKIIIPKEEPKQETLEEVDNEWSLSKAQEFALSKFKRGKIPSKGIMTWEAILEVLKVGVLTGHKFGAKWQQERSYSEEDMEKSFEAGRSYHEHLEMQKAKYFEPDDTHKIDYKKYSFKEWFEQFKKK